MTINYDYPTEEPVVGPDGHITAAWGQWVQRTHNNARTLQQSGSTAERPTSVLWIGRFYFDTTLNKPIWIQQVKPVVVWCDATGAAV
jgi:hypothetical protein